jgi:hypothetical protein
MQIGKTQYSLEPSHEIGVGGDTLTIRRSASGGVRVDGNSSRIVINGEVLSKTGIELIPQWVQTNLLNLILLLSNVATFVWGFFWGRRRVGGKSPLA